MDQLDHRLPPDQQVEVRTQDHPATLGAIVDVSDLNDEIVGGIDQRLDQRRQDGVLAVEVVIKGGRGELERSRDVDDSRPVIPLLAEQSKRSLQDPVSSDVGWSWHPRSPSSSRRRAGSATVAHLLATWPPARARAAREPNMPVHLRTQSSRRPVWRSADERDLERSPWGPRRRAGAPCSDGRATCAGSMSHHRRPRHPCGRLARRPRLLQRPHARSARPSPSVAWCNSTRVQTRWSGGAGCRASSLCAPGITRTSHSYSLPEVCRVVAASWRVCGSSLCRLRGPPPPAEAFGPNSRPRTESRKHGRKTLATPLDFAVALQ